MVFTSFISSQMTSIVRKLLLTVLFLVVLTHAVGILLPETGFDALWYHLPIVKDMAVSREIRYLPDIPQSNQPRLGEILFTPWFILFGTAGVKACTFLLMLVLLLLTYVLATRYLDSTSALCVVLLVTTFHTIAWQATSAYVDVVRTIFELTILILLSKKKASPHETIWLGLFLMGALLTKLVTLLFVPSLLVYVVLERGWRRVVPLVFIIVFVYFLGKFPINFFFVTSHELINWSVLFGSIKSFFLLPLELSFHIESYTTPLFLFVGPFVLMSRQWLWQAYRREILFLLASFFTWVFIVPISVRYDVSAIILATILSTSVLMHIAVRYPFMRTIFMLFLIANVILNMSVRVGAIARALPFLLGRQSQQQYICGFDRGILHGPLESWYKPHRCDAVQ